MKLVTWALHLPFLFFIVPLLCVIPALIFGALLSPAEGWAFIDGILYSGGGLVLITLTDVVPSTTGGIFLDVICSCLSLGIFSWLLALVGTFPIAASLSKPPHAKRINSPVGKEAVALTSFICLFMPFIFAILSLLFGGPLAAAEGWDFDNSFLFTLGIFAHAPSLSTAAPTTHFGKIASFVVATYALTIAIGLVVGTFILLDSMDQFVKFFSKFFPASVIGQFACFIVAACFFVPLVMTPFAAIMGGIIAAIEGSDFMDNFLLMTGNIVLLNLTPYVPHKPPSLACDFAFSCIGIGLFGFLVAWVGALPFVDTCADKIGLKKEGALWAVLSALLFFVIVLPLVSSGSSLVLGGLLAAGEGWSFGDGFLFTLSVMIQSPGLAPPDAVATTVIGKIMIFITACIGICISIGWGAGMIVASAGLDRAGKFATKIITRFEKTVEEASEEIPNPEGGGAGSPAATDSAGAEANKKVTANEVAGPDTANKEGVRPPPSSAAKDAERNEKSATV